MTGISFIRTVSFLNFEDSHFYQSLCFAGYIYDLQLQSDCHISEIPGRLGAKYKKKGLSSCSRMKLTASATYLPTASGKVKS